MISAKYYRVLKLILVASITTYAIYVTRSAMPLWMLVVLLMLED